MNYTGEYTRGADKSLARLEKEINKNDQNRDLFKILPTKLNTFLNLLL